MTSKLTLEQAIQHAEEKYASLCGPCATQHKQLAEWLRELQKRRNADSEPVVALKLPPKLSNDREGAHELNAGVDTWNRCIDEVAKINGEMIIAGRVDGLHPTTSALVNDFATALAEKLRKAELKYGYSNAWTNNGWMTECLADFHQHIAKGDPRDVAAYCAFMWYHGWKTEAEQPAPVVPEVLPCPVLLEPGLRFGKGIKTRTVLAALARREVYESDMAALSPEEKAEFWSKITDLKALLSKQTSVSPDFDTWFNGPDAGLRVVNYHIQRELQESAWNACHAAMLQAGNSPVIPDGYVLVPKEPTEEMINAWLSEVANWRGHISGYKAMLAAVDCSIPMISDRWIPVSERMPEDEQEVLTTNRMGHRFVSFFDKHSGLFFDRIDAPAACCIEHVLVTHWMPLPAAPQEVNHG